MFVGNYRFRAAPFSDATALLEAENIAQTGVATTTAVGMVLAARATAVNEHRAGKLLLKPSGRSAAEGQLLPASVAPAPGPATLKFPVMVSVSFAMSRPSILTPPPYRSSRDGLAPTELTATAPVIAAGIDQNAIDHSGMTPSQVATALLRAKAGGLEHRAEGKCAAKTFDEHTERQYHWAATLLEKSMNVDPFSQVRPLSSLTESDLVTLDKAFEVIPVTIGKSPWDRASGTTLTMIADGAAMRVAAGTLLASKIGLDGETTDKHFRKIAALHKFLRTKIE